MTRLLFVLAALAALSSGCRKPLPSPDYIEASNRYTNLLALHGDDAFATPEMDEVNAQLGRVLAKSSDYSKAQALIATIASERERVHAAAVKAAVVAPLPAPNFPPLPAEAPPSAPVAAPVAEVAAPTEFGNGAAFAPLLAKYPGCLLSLGPITMNAADGGKSPAEGFELHDSAHCRGRIPALTGQIALVQNDKIAQVFNKSALKTVTLLEDGGVVLGTLMEQQTFMTLMRLVPKSALSSAVGMATRFPAPASMHHAAIRVFARRYKVNLEEAELPIEDYPTLGQFFTRRLKAGARTIDSARDAIVSPVDGAVSQVGAVLEGQCLQAKGISFPVDKLLGDPREAAVFSGGSFATLYLAPKDYHRIHSPIAGKITGYNYLPGEFWPVNPASVNTTQALFAINERLVTYLDTELGKVAVVAVGATCVARIHASYDAILTHTGQPARAHKYERPIAVERGGELGMFEMGSTVILVFEKGKIAWDPKLLPDVPVMLGERIGRKL